MRKIAASVLIAVHTVTLIPASAAPVRRTLTVDSLPKPDSIDDCVLEYQLTNTSLRVSTMKGRSLEVFRGEGGKVELVIQNGKAFKPTYDAAQMLISFKSLDDGVEHPALTDSDTVPPEIQERLQQIMDSVKPCEGFVIPQPKQTDGEYCPPQIFFDGGGFRWYSDFERLGYWERQHRPYFDAEVRYALDRNAQRSCIIRYTACLDACQHAEDIRGYSCMAFGLIYMSVPVAAAIGVGVCIWGSNRERNRCIAACAPIVECF